MELPAQKKTGQLIKPKPAYPLLRPQPYVCILFLLTVRPTREDYSRYVCQRMVSNVIGKIATSLFESWPIRTHISLILIQNNHPSHFIAKAYKISRAVTVTIVVQTPATHSISCKSSTARDAVHHLQGDRIDTGCQHGWRKIRD
jgi:hypothetical protein